MVKEKLIRFKDLTINQMEFIASHLLLIPGTIKVTYETLPAFKTIDEEGREEIIPYERRQSIAQYMDAHGKYFVENDGDIYTEWDQRTVICVWGRKVEEVNSSHFEMSDIQSMWPVGADIWSTRMENCFMTCIAPLALLLPETWGLYGMEVTPQVPHRDIPFGAGGKGKGTIEAVWRAIGGEISTMEPDEHAASILTLDHWQLCAIEEWKEIVPEVLAHIRKELGEERYAELRSQPSQIFHANDTEEEEE